MTRMCRHHFALPMPKKTTKTAQQAAKEANFAAKPSFTAIYAEKLSLKNDYRKEMINTRMKWKQEDLEDRKAARLAAQFEAERQKRLERKHQLLMETISTENVRKKARADYDHALQLAFETHKASFAHEKLMVEAASKTALLQTLFASNKTTYEIRALLEIVETAE
jgi:hypothetical protein